MSAATERIERQLQELLESKTGNNGWLDEDEVNLRNRLMSACGRTAGTDMYSYLTLTSCQWEMWERLFRTGRLDESRKMFLKMEETDRRFRRIRGPHPRLRMIAPRLKKMYRGHRSLRFTERYSESLAADYEYVAKRKPLTYPKPVARWYREASVEFYRKRRYAECEKMLKKSVLWYGKAYDDEYETPPEIMTSLYLMSDLYRIQGRRDARVRALKKALSYAEYFAELDGNFRKYVSGYREELEDIKKR